jgi:hypothetical protein
LPNKSTVSESAMTVALWAFNKGCGHQHLVCHGCPPKLWLHVAKTSHD